MGLWGWRHWPLVHCYNHHPLTLWFGVMGVEWATIGFFSQRPHLVMGRLSNMAPCNYRTCAYYHFWHRIMVPYNHCTCVCCYFQRCTYLGTIGHQGGGGHIKGSPFLQTLQWWSLGSSGMWCSESLKGKKIQIMVQIFRIKVRKLV